MRSKGQRDDRRFAVVCSAITLVATTVVFTIGVCWAVTRCAQINAEKEVKLGQIAVGQTTQFDFRMQLDSRQVTTLNVPRPEVSGVPQMPHTAESLKPLLAR